MKRLRDSPLLEPVAVVEVEEERLEWFDLFDFLEEVLFFERPLVFFSFFSAPFVLSELPSVRDLLVNILLVRGALVGALEVFVGDGLGMDKVLSRPLAARRFLKVVPSRSVRWALREEGSGSLTLTNDSTNNKLK